MERGLYNKIGGKKMNKKGFSLVEIMLVMAIIGLLVSLLLPFISKARWNAQMRKCGSKLGSLYKLLEDYVSRAGGSYFIYRTTTAIGRTFAEGDPLPVGSDLWRLLQSEQVDSLDEMIRNNPAELRKQVYELYVCNIKGAAPVQGAVTYRGPAVNLTVATMEGGRFVGGDDIGDHGQRIKNVQINVLLGDGSVRPQVEDDINFNNIYSQTTTK